MECEEEDQLSKDLYSVFDLDNLIYADEQKIDTCTRKLYKFMLLAIEDFFGKKEPDYDVLIKKLIDEEILLFEYESTRRWKVYDRREKSIYTTRRTLNQQTRRIKKNIVEYFFTDHIYLEELMAYQVNERYICFRNGILNFHNYSNYIGLMILYFKKYHGV
jgi:hypothetical protein